MLQLADLAPHFAHLEGAIDEQADLGEVEGLDDEVENAVLDRPHRRIEVSVGGHQDHRRAGAQLEHRAHGLDSREAGHADVHQHDVRRLGAEHGQPLLAAARG